MSARLERQALPPAIKEVMDEIERTQVVIMAGGMGKRMGLNKPKPLIEVCGKTLIDRCIEYYQANGYRDIVVLVGYKANEVEAHVRRTHPEVSVARDPWDPSEKPVGKAKALKHALETGAVDRFRRAIVAFPDDLFLDPQLPVRLLMRHLQGVRLHDIWATAVFALPANYPYGTARIGSDGLVEEFVEKPKVDIVTSTGIYLFEPPAYDLVMDVDMNAPHAVEFEEEVVPRLASMRKLYAMTIPGDVWIPVNTQKDLERAERLLSGLSTKGRAREKDRRR